MMQVETPVGTQDAGIGRRAAVLAWLCTPRAFWVLFFIVATLRFQAIARFQLVPDEAYYWVWTRHLSLSYFDHPPMVAWLIWLSTRIFGESEFAIRFPAAITSLLSIPLIMLAARAAMPERAAARLAGLFLLLSAVTTVTGTVTTPDAPAWFFGVASMTAACWAVKVECRRRSAWLWVAFGVLLGLACLSKYTAALIGPSTFLGLLASRDGRRHLLRPWYGIAAALCVACCAPIFAWNIRHDWPSFRFQLNHGFGEDKVGPLKGLGEYIVGQALAWTPLVYLLSLAALWTIVRRFRASTPVMRLLLACFLATGLLFLSSSLRRRVEMNWPFVMYAPLGIITAWYVSQNWRGRRATVAFAALVFASVVVIGLQSPLAVEFLGSRIRKLAQGQGYPELAQEVHRLANGRPVFANRYQEASELSYYMPAKPVVWAINVGGSRTNMFDYFDGKPDYKAAPSAVFVNCPRDEIEKDFIIRQAIEWPTEIFGRVMRRDRIFIADRLPR